MATCSTRSGPAAALTELVGGLTEKAVSARALPGLIFPALLKRCEETTRPFESRKRYSHSTARTVLRASLRTTTLYWKPGTSLPAGSTYQFAVYSQGL